MAGQMEFQFVETRRESWKEKREKLAGQRLRVLAEFERCGEHGATIAEIAAVLAGGHSNRVTQTIKDLREAEFIEATSERRAVVGGKPSVVMRVKES
jgi:DNA-binding MarR family transcriptional regulator